MKERRPIGSLLAVAAAKLGFVGQCDNIALSSYQESPVERLRLLAAVKKTMAMISLVDPVCYLRLRQRVGYIVDWPSVNVFDSWANPYARIIYLCWPVEEPSSESEHLALTVAGRLVRESSYIALVRYGFRNSHEEDYLKLRRLARKEENRFLRKASKRTGVTVPEVDIDFEPRRRFRDVGLMDGFMKRLRVILEAIRLGSSSHPK